MRYPEHGVVLQLLDNLQEVESKKKSRAEERCQVEKVQALAQSLFIARSEGRREYFLCHAVSGHFNENAA